MTTPTWKTIVRRWAREQAATHAVIAGCGDERRLTISGCLGAVDAVHTYTRDFTARVWGDSHINIHDPSGDIRAVIHTPTISKGPA